MQDPLKPAKRFTDNDQAKMVQMHEQDKLSIRTIASIWKCSRGTVQYHIKQAQLRAQGLLPPVGKPGRPARPPKPVMIPLPLSMQPAMRPQAPLCRICLIRPAILIQGQGYTPCENCS